MKIKAYADTNNGCHICLECVRPNEIDELYPLTTGELFEYTYADYEVGIIETPNYPSCDRCREEIEFQTSEEKARTLVTIMGVHLGQEVAEETDDIDGFRETYTQYASWANEYLPLFRRLAGYKDNGHGTYREGGDPNAMYILEELLDLFWGGVYRGFETRRESLETL